ncbi:unnamed protein product [Calypogeia fissa]
MRLYNFVNLPWDTMIGTNAQCSEFVTNSTIVASMVDGHLTDMTEENLVEVFKLGIGDSRDIVARARSWQS